LKLHPLLNLALLKPKCLFLALTMQMAHCSRDKLTDFWATVDQLYTPLYGTMMKRGRYLHTLRYLRFTDIRNEPDRTDETFGRLWKIPEQFEILNRTFSKFYSPSEDLAVDEFFVSFKGRVLSSNIQVYSQETQAFLHQNFQTLWLDWINV
jgi:hypothetical protein